VNTAPAYRWLGRQPYAPFAAAMLAHAQGVQRQTTEEAIWCCEHDPIYTTGRRAIDNRTAPTLPAPLIISDRGGETTFHGPGQLMLYPILNLKQRGLAPRAYVRLLEESCIDLLADYGIPATRRSGAPGVWVDQRKIAAIGLRISHGVVWHGMALNICTDLAWFDAINPCGLPWGMDRFCDHLDAPALAVLAQQWADQLIRELKGVGKQK